ncbi:hypothetical protein AAG570_008759 [Ranatra chinensis]|uniref:Uncharacterized protein n=1 Tax=Ranatra chinensis TaxID=642074 RepID=A0ABD0Z4Q6_9HEMI
MGTVSSVNAYDDIAPPSNIGPFAVGFDKRYRDHTKERHLRSMQSLTPPVRHRRMVRQEALADRTFQESYNRACQARVTDVGFSLKKIQNKWDAIENASRIHIPVTLTTRNSTVPARR